MTKKRNAVKSTIRFELRKLAKGDSMIRMIYQVKGIRAYYSTKQKVYSDNWDDQRAKYVKGGSMTKNEVDEVNDALNSLVTKIEAIEDNFKALQKKIDAYVVVEELDQTKKANTSSELFNFIDQYIERNANQRAAGSLNVYRTLKEHLQNFESSKSERVTFATIDYNFFESFQNYLNGLTKKNKEGHLVKRLNNISVAKQLSTLRTFLNYARRTGIEVSSKYDTFIIERETDLEVIALTQAEFDKLVSLDLYKTNPAWERVKDVFIFSCVTGLRFSDLKQLKPSHIKQNVIDLTQVKTSSRVKVPLNSYSRALLNKYNNQLPVISNQRSNEHLKKIFEWNGFNRTEEIVRKYGAKRVTKDYKLHELVSFHCGRKTFASLSLAKGMKVEQVMKIGGWKDYKSFKRYMNINDDTSQEAMVSAWDRPASSKLKAV